MTDCGTTAAKTLFESEVRKRQKLFGMSGEQAEMLVAVLMSDRRFECSTGAKEITPEMLKSVLG